MSIDNVFVNLVTDELKSRTVNGKINSVRQINREEYLFLIYTNDEKINLLFNCTCGAARVCLSDLKYSFTEKPSNFMLLLKKHLSYKRIISVEQANQDRIIKFSFSGSNQFGDEKISYLYAELIGNNTNMILCDESGIIIDCLKKKEYCASTNRAVLPGLLYRFPPRPNGCVLPSADIDSVKKLSEYSENFECYLKGINGISAKIKSNFTSYSDFFAFLDYLYGTNKYYYCYESSNGIKVLSYYPLKDCVEFHCSIFNSPSEAFDFYYKNIDTDRRNSLLTKKVSSFTNSILQRRQNKLIKLQTEFDACSNKDQFLNEAELLKANMFSYNKGDRFVKCIDYFSDKLEERVINVDPFAEPSVYLKSLYKKYTKLKNAETALSKEISKCKYEIEYLESVKDELNRVINEADVTEIENELINAGYIKKKDYKKNNSFQQMIHGITDSGIEIIAGSNNSQNDDLTFKKAGKNDLWFHVKNQHGSHVILQSSHSNVSEGDIIKAAEYAAYYSGARNSGKAAVDYTKVSNVKRNSPYYPGRVLYTDYKTIIVSSEGDNIKK